MRKEKIYEMCIQYQIYTPQFLTEAKKLKSVNKIWWWFCRIRPWRYKMNYYHKFLVQKNNYTRSWNFEENYEEKPTFFDATESIKKIIN